MKILIFYLLILCLDYSKGKLVGSKKGFLKMINVYAEDKQTEVGCGTYPLEEGTSYKIQSPFYQYGAQYPNSYECIWKFYGTAGCSPVISCENFKVAQSNGCSADYLEISDGISGSQKYCGTTGPNKVVTGSSAMRATFKTDFFGTDKGFQCVVSCLADSSETTLIPNALMPPEQVNTNCKCGEPGDIKRIVGGTNAEKYKWKWQAALVLRGRNGPFCGGALISDRFILTAAHCVVTTGLVAGLQGAAEIVLNEYDTSNPNETQTIKRNILAITPHPFYNTGNQDYDAALIEFTPPVPLGAANEPKVTPVCLPKVNERTSFAGDSAVIIGWGTTTEGGDQPSILQEAMVPVITNEECNKQYEDRITPRMVCAGFPEGKIDSCQGDSGGPMTFERDGRFTEIGVVSFGEGCARPNKAGVYARVTEINDWIRQVAKNSVWCVE